MQRTVRPLAPQDISILTQTCWTHRPPREINDLLTRLKRLREQQRGDGFVLEQGTEIVGFGALTLWVNRAEISDLVVAPALRSQGIGTHLIHFLVEVARAHRAKVVEIGVTSDNTRALQLYQRLGFVLARAITLQHGSMPERILYLEKPLGRYRQKQQDSRYLKPRYLKQ